MGFKPLFITGLILFLGLVSCDSTTNARLASETGSMATTVGEDSGSVQLRMVLAEPGFLARGQAVPRYRIEHMVAELYKVGDALPLISDTIAIYGALYFVYSRMLDIRSSWIVRLKALDSTGEVRYEGQESFQPRLNEQTRLTVTLHPKEYEMRLMMLGFEGLSRVEVSVGYNDNFSWNFDSTVRTGDTVMLSHIFNSTLEPYATTLSSSRRVIVSVFGSNYGTQAKFFTCDTNLRVRYGEDSIVRLNLRWVGGKFPIDTMELMLADAVVPSQPMFFGLVYPKNFLPVGDTGAFVDIRDGKSYGFKRFGAVTWMTENLRYGCDNCGLAGARYQNPDYVATVCPIGWRIPAEKEWEDLIETASQGEGAMTGLIHLMTPNWFSGERHCGYEDPSNLPEDAHPIWSGGPDLGGEPSGGDDSSGFHLVPTGRIDWEGGHLSTSYELANMWSRWSGGMSHISIHYRSHAFVRPMDYGEGKFFGIRCVTD
jgi:uncharacterized protein (TIGR02145 family)